MCYIITGLAQAVLGSSASLVTSLVLLVVAIVLELAVLSARPRDIADPQFIELRNKVTELIKWW